jgi:DNA repair protein SbcD/Mre11
MISFVHTADIHFGMENYGKIDPQSGIHSRLLDFEQALNRCIDFAISNNVDFFLFSGDAYKTATPSPTQQRLLFGCFLRLFQANIPLVIVIGNHDNPLSFGKAHALDLFGQLPINGFHVIAKPSSFILQTKSGPIQIVGIPWPCRTTLALNNYKFASSSPTELTSAISRSVATLIKNFAQELDTTLPAVLAGHLSVSSGIFSGSEKRAIYGTDPVFLPSDLAIYPFDYVALGHLHRYQNLNPHGYPALVYSGSLERIDFGERKEDKGFCFVTISQKGTTTHNFIKIPTRPFIQIEVNITESNRTQTDQILAALTHYNLQGAVVKILYRVPLGKKDRVDTVALQQACKTAQYLVGIFPIRTIEARERRAVLPATMGMHQLLDIYFATKIEWKDKRKYLIEKTLQLIHEDSGEI